MDSSVSENVTELSGNKGEEFPASTSKNGEDSKTSIEEAEPAASDNRMTPSTTAPVAASGRVESNGRWRSQRSREMN